MTSSGLRVLVVGVGLHAEHAHLPMLKALSEVYDLEIVGALDLANASRRARSRLNKSGWPEARLFGVSGASSSSELDDVEELYARLDTLRHALDVNAMVISTPPERHLGYLSWALTRGVHVLVDKPVISRRFASTRPEEAERLAADIDEAVSLLDRALTEQPHLVAAALVHRRANPAFQRVESLISRVREATGCGVTSITAEHSDGEWRMPTELREQTYHGVADGLGVLSHSGYHVLDAAIWFLSTTTDADPLRIRAHSSRPPDFMAQIDDRVLGRVFPGHDWSAIDQISAKRDIEWGEWDAHVTLQSLKAHRIVATATLHLLHSSYSHRGWPRSEGRDLYVGNGRVSHEQFSIHQGPFQTIKINAWQGGRLSTPSSPYDVEGPRHCEVHVFRNTAVLEGTTYERFDLSDLDHVAKGLEHLGPGKMSIYTDFVERCLSRVPGDDPPWSLARQIPTLRAYAGVVHALAAEWAGGR